MGPIRLLHGTSYATSDARGSKRSHPRCGECISSHLVGRLAVGRAGR
jgi:hypothetical protein